jgi:hypothetical protein
MPAASPSRFLRAALAAQIGFELSEHGEHVDEALAGSSTGIDRLFGCPQ